MTTDDRVRYEVDDDNRIATITYEQSTQRNSYDAPMRETLARYPRYRRRGRRHHRRSAARGRKRDFSTRADMNNAYGWYGDKADKEQRRRPVSAGD